MLYQFDDYKIKIHVNPNLKNMDVIYENIKGSSVSYIMQSFFQEFFNSNFTGEVTSTFNGWDKIQFSFKDGKLHTNNPKHAAISSKKVKIFIQNGKLRTRDNGPCGTIYEDNYSKYKEAFFIDDEISYDHNDLFKKYSFILATSFHIEHTIFDIIGKTKPKYGPRYIKRLRNNQVYVDFFNKKLNDNIINYLIQNDLDYSDVKKEDWELIIFQCNMVK
jgi:hypothetical protein